MSCILTFLWEVMMALPNKALQSTARSTHSWLVWPLLLRNLLLVEESVHPVSSLGLVENFSYRYRSVYRLIYPS